MGKFRYKIRHDLPPAWVDFLEEFIRPLKPHTLDHVTQLTAQILALLTDEIERRLERKPPQ